MEKPVYAAPGVPEQTSLDSSPSHLCQPCVSALTVDELEVGRIYPHHRTLRSCLDAYQMRCYICSSLLEIISEDEHKTLQLLAKGQMPESTNGDSDCSRSYDDSLPSTHKIMDEIENDWRYKAHGGSFVSLTGLRIHTNGNLMEIAIRLNPAYDEALPAGMKLYEAAPSIWKVVSNSIFLVGAPVVITAKGPSGPSNQLRII